MQKFNAFMLICTLVLCSFLPITYAEDAVYQSGAYNYVLDDDGNAIIVGHQEGETKLVVPTELNGHTVVGIGKEAFYNDHYIKELVVPGSIKTIAERAFAYTDQIREVTIESGVELIEKEAFLYCQIYELSLPETLVSIGDRAFGCNNFSSIQLPDSIRHIGINPFDICDNLSIIIVRPENPFLSVIDGVLFAKNDKRLVCKPLGLSIEKYQIPKGIKIIGERSFLGDVALVSVSIPDSVEKIEASAFDECIKLKEVKIDGNGLKEIEEEAFWRCSLLSDINFPESLEKIGEKCFSECSLLKDIELNEGLIYIGDEVFDNCVALLKITIPNSVTEIGINPFKSCTKLESIEISKNNKSFESINSVLFSADLKRLICYPICKTDTQYKIPEGVEIIESYAFYSSVFLQSIILPETVNQINDSAFIFCEYLREVNIPKNVSSIGEKVFLGCKMLTTVKVTRDSVAADYCRENGISYGYSDGSDWLND